MSNIYRHADRALKRVYSLIEQRFQRMALTAKWDELNVISAVSSMYDEIDRYAREQYQQIAEEAYEDARKEIVKVQPEKKDDMKGLKALFILAILRGYDSKTEYRYDREWERKQDRLAESILSIDEAERRIVNSNAIREALQRGVNLAERQVRQMADTITDEARNQAFRDAGIWRLKWNTEQDSRVCATCQEREGQIYDIDNLPPKHRNCRCHLTAVLGTNP